MLAFWMTGFVGEWGLRIGLVWEKAAWGRSGPCWGVWGCFWVGSFGEPEGSPVACIWRVGFCWSLEMVMV